MIRSTLENRDPLDVDLQARVRLSLALRNRASLRALHVEVLEGVVTLRGRVPLFYDRLLAVETVRHVAGVHAVRDEIAVADSDATRGGRPARIGAPIETASLPSVEGVRTGNVAARAASATLSAWSLAFAVSLASFLTGCGGDAGDRVPVFPVSGQITQGGKPLAGAQVVFHPKNPSDSRTPVAQGRTDESGKYQLTSYETNDGAAAGEYAVTVQLYQLIKSGESYSPGPNILPPKLSTPDTTDLKATVAAGPTEVPPIEVKK